MCSSRKYPYPPQGRLTEIPKWRGVSKAQFFKGKYVTKMEFQEGWGREFKLKNLLWEGYGYFLEQHITMITFSPLQEIELTEALCGFQKTIEMLDKRQLVITSHPGEIIRPGKFLLLCLEKIIYH